MTIVKNIIASVVIILTTCSTVFSQFEIGIYTGLNSSKISNNFLDELFPQGRLVNPMVGISPQYLLNKNLCFTLGLQYSPKGLKLVRETSTSKDRYTYFDIIPEVNYKINRYIKAGIGVNYGKLINEEFNINESGWNSPRIPTVNSTDFGLIFKLYFKINSLFTFIQYNHGLGDLTDLKFTSVDGQFIQEIDQYNRNIQIGIGYEFIPKKE